MSYRSAQRLIEEDKLKWIRYPLAFLFRLGALLKNFCYDKGIAKSAKSSAFVVSVGNIVAGGTGKTPIIAMLAQDFIHKQGGPLAILTRGYGREKKGFLDLSTKQYGPQECGDEPYLLAKKLKTSRVLVTKNRKEAALQIKSGLIFLDDGMQYRKLQRDLEIVVMNANCPFGKGHFLPRGYLRDPIHRLQQADYIFLNHYQEDGTLEKIQKYTKAPIIGVKYDLKLSAPAEKVGVFCGIGSPESFVNSLKEMGLEVVDTLFVKDHALPGEKQLVEFSKSCQKKGATALVCTEKDFIKFQNQLVSRLPVLYAYGKIIILTGNKFYENLIRRLTEYETMD